MSNIYWAYEVAHELIRKHPNKEMFVCASGISPSGSVHIGNFREIVTTYFVVRALQDLGKKTRFIFSWDDYDRFRKVPKILIHLLQSILVCHTVIFQIRMDVITRMRSILKRV